MKFISPDRRFLYYLRERPDTALEGLRVSCSQVRPVFSSTPVRSADDLKNIQVSRSVSPLPAEPKSMPGDIMVALIVLSQEHSELLDLLTGKLHSFIQALRSA